MKIILQLIIQTLFGRKPEKICDDLPPSRAGCTTNIHLTILN